MSRGLEQGADLVVSMIANELAVQTERSSTLVMQPLDDQSVLIATGLIGKTITYIHTNNCSIRLVISQL